MLVEINLLPQKEKRSIMMFIILGAVFLISIATAVVGYYMYQSKVQQLDGIQSEIEFTIALREIEEQKRKESQELEGLDELVSKIDWITSQRISLVFLLNHLVSLLPERGYFLSYQYGDQGTVSINVQFDTSRDAANYLHLLNESPYITKATLQSLNTNVLPEEETVSSDYLPRYTANYSITIDRDAVKKEEKKEE